MWRNACASDPGGGAIPAARNQAVDGASREALAVAADAQLGLRARGAGIAPCDTEVGVDRLDRLGPHGYDADSATFAVDPQAGGAVPGRDVATRRAMTSPIRSPTPAKTASRP